MKAHVIPYVYRCILKGLIPGLVFGIAGATCNQSNIPIDNVVTAIEGSVKDVSGKPIQGVQVLCGSYTGPTDETGHYLLRVDAGDDQIVVFFCPGYITCSRRVHVYEGQVTYLPVIMKAEAPARTANTAGETTITGERNASITIPEGVLVDASGNPVTGNVGVHLTPYDPGIPEELSAYPGDLRGLDVTGQTVTLVTYGLMDVTIRQNGEQLQIRDGQTITIRVPAPTSGEKPDTAAVWIYNAQAGLWLQSEYGDAAYDADTNTYVAAIGHLSPCNIDQPILPTCIWGLVKDAENNPVAGALIEAIPASYGRISSDFTDMNGYYCMYVERNMDMDINVWTPLTETCPVELQYHSYCVTSLTFHSGSNPVDAGYPTDCSGNCRQVPSITTGDLNPGPLDEADCTLVAGVENPFWGTCASGLADFYECFAPQGKCTYELDPFNPMGASMLLEFENGSKQESEFSPLQGMVINVYGPDDRGNPLCGTMVPDEEGMTITTASGQSYTMRTTESGGMEIVCWGGQTFTVTPEQLDFIAGCEASQQEDGSGVACEPEPGTFGSECVFDSDCTSDDLACCGPVGGEKTCQMEVMCDFICHDDWDCSGGDVCCDAGQYNICMPPAACR